MKQCWHPSAGGYWTVCEACVGQVRLPSARCCLAPFFGSGSFSLDHVRRSEEPGQCQPSFEGPLLTLPLARVMRVTAVENLLVVHLDGLEILRRVSDRDSDGDWSFDSTSCSCSLRSLNSIDDDACRSSSTLTVL